MDDCLTGDSGRGGHREAPGRDPAEADSPRSAGHSRWKESVRRFFSQAGITKDANDRLTLFVVRSLFFFAAAGLGLFGSDVVTEVTQHSHDRRLGVLIACGIAILLILVERVFSRSPIRTLSAITLGLIMGLTLSILFTNVVSLIVEALMDSSFFGNYGGIVLDFLQIVTTTVFCYLAVTTLLRTKDDFKFIIPYVEFRKEVRTHAPLIFDTSTFVDGRIETLLTTGVFGQRLIVPKFVLNELQTIADSSDRSLRQRGRRGMDILDEIEEKHHLEVFDREVPKGGDVDLALISLASELGGKILSTDYNLQKNAKLQGVAFLNINDLATSLKPSFLPGEFMEVRLLREGDDEGQAVGFLNDGTMVVVENARERIGQQVAIEVTSSLQTNAGKMVFGKLRRKAKAASQS
jgi:uncharacterized protein YacL